MMLEVVVLLALLSSGALLLRTAGLRGWGLVPLGLLVGASVFTVMATLQAALFLPTAPLATLTVTVVGPLLWWSWSWRSDRDVRLDPVRVTATVAVITSAVWLLREADLTRVTPDSYSLLSIGTLLENGHLGVTPAGTLEAWQIALGALHAPAHFQGEFYLRSMMPLLAVATVGALIWFIDRSLRGEAGQASGLAGWIAGLGGALLVTNQRFLFHAFYLNRHMMIAATVLLAGAAVWGLSRQGVERRPVLYLLAGTSLLALAVGRGETPVIAGMILLPLLTTTVLERRSRALLLAGLGGVILLWNMSLLARYLSQGRLVSGTALTFSVLGLLALLASLPIARGWRWFDPLPRWVMPLAEGGLWVFLLVLVARDGRVVLESAANTYANIVLGQGSWGVSLLVLAALTVAALVLTREADRAALRLPMTAFVPFAVILAYLRTPEGLPYRVGETDSLNRMLLHFVPLAIFYVASSPTTSLRRWVPSVANVATSGLGKAGDPVSRMFMRRE